MTNKELQDAINETWAMAKNSSPGGYREDCLNNHLLSLLGLQRMRASGDEPGMIPSGDPEPVKVKMVKYTAFGKVDLNGSWREVKGE